MDNDFENDDTDNDGELSFNEFYRTIQLLYGFSIGISYFKKVI